MTVARALLAVTFDGSGLGGLVVRFRGLKGPYDTPLCYDTPTVPYGTIGMRVDACRTLCTALGVPYVGNLLDRSP